MAQKYALFVGSSEYDSESLVDLKAPIADVRDLANLFRNPEIGGFDQVTELINSSETEIRQAVGSFFLNKKPEDLLLLYFSGHGVLDDRGHLYLAVKDTKPDLLRATAISADFIADDMDLCRSKRQVLILDCCHSGAFRRGIKGGGKALTQSTFEGNGSGRIVLTASDRREFAMEGNQVLEAAQTSLFTHFLLEGLKSGEADRDGDSFISLDEWYDYAYDKVVSNLPTQTPRRWVYNQEGRLIIARNPKPESIKPPELPRELRESMRDPRPKIRLRAATELAHILDGSDQRLALAARTALDKMLKDDSPEVKEAVKEVLAGYDRDSVSGSGAGPAAGLPGSETVEEEELAGLLHWLREKILAIFAILRWKALTLGIAVGAVMVLSWIWLPTSDRNITGDETGNSLAEQADITGGGNLLNTPEESGQNGDNQETSPPIIENNDPPNEPDDPADKEIAAPLEQDKNPPEENKDTGGTDDTGGPETVLDDQQGKQPLQLDETQNPEETKEETGDENPAGTEEPINRLMMDITELQDAVRRAIQERRWAGVPLPLADYYEPRLDALYARHTIMEVGSTVGELQTDENTAMLPVTMEIFYQQKGREEVQTIPVPANWVWKKSEEGFVLSEVH